MDPAQITGAWRLLYWRIEYSDDRPATYPFGSDATGLLLYTHDGFMSAGLSRANRPGLGGGSARKTTAESRANAFDSHFQYQGRYHIEGETIVHTVTEALNPDFPGSMQVRQAVLEGDTLELSATDTLPTTGITRRHVLKWQKAG